MSFKSFAGKLRVLSEERPWLYNVEVWLLNGKTNRNNWRYENLEKHVACFEETPILCAFVNGKVGDGHNFRTKRDRRTGEEYSTFMDSDAERIVGWFAPGSIRLDNKDGVDWIVGQGKVWAYYNKELVDNLTAQGSEGMEVSIETLVSDGDIRMEGDTEVYSAYEVLGTTILGKGVTPAVAGANIRAMSAMGDKLNELKLRVASYIEHGEDGILEKGVKKPMSKKLCSQMAEKFPRHKVIGVSDDGLNVLLCSVADGDILGYTFAEDDNGQVIDTKYQRVLNAACDIEFQNGYKVNQSLESILEPYASLYSEHVAAKKLLQEAQDALAEMRMKEEKRRKKAAHDAIRRELEEINADVPEEEKVDEKVCEDIDKDIDNGCYGTCEEDGEWCGDRKACEKLKSICMDKIKQQRKKNALNSKKVYVWDSHDSAKETKLGGNVENLLREMNVK